MSYGSAVRIEATYFNQRFIDMIDYNGAAVDPEPNYNNIAKAQANGVEVELHHPAVFGVYFDLSGSLLDSKVLESGNSASPTASLA